MINMSAFSIIFFSVTIVMSLTGCDGKNTRHAGKLPEDSITVVPAISDTPGIDTVTAQIKVADKEIAIETVPPDSLVAFAKTLIGIPYLYASTDPQKGFDCSGFITYLFNHFNFSVPRSSADFTNFGQEIVMEKAKPGDLILFTGTDSSSLIVGHMGIIESVKDDTLWFIHSTSGKAKGVVISPFSDYYKKRFVKVIRVFRDEFFN
jgi:cell wall-associated NlpC family hydrolase